MKLITSREDFHQMEFLKWVTRRHASFRPDIRAPNWFHANVGRELQK